MLKASRQRRRHSSKGDKGGARAVPILICVRVVCLSPGRLELLLPHSYARHQLLGPPGVVRHGLKAHPLMVELWRRDQYENDVCLGLCLLQVRLPQQQPRRSWRAPTFAAGVHARSTLDHCGHSPSIPAADARVGLGAGRALPGRCADRLRQH